MYSGWVARPAKLWALVIASISGLLAAIRFVADVDFIVTRSHDPGWMMGLPAFFQTLYIADWLIGGLAILSLVIVLCAIRTSNRTENNRAEPEHTDIRDTLPDDCNTWVPLKEAFDQIAKHSGFHGTTEADQKQMYSIAARLVRQAAKTDGLRLRGNKHNDMLPDEVIYADVKKPIPETHWDHNRFIWSEVINSNPNKSQTIFDEASLLDDSFVAGPKYYNIDIHKNDLDHHWPLRTANGDR